MINLDQTPNNDQCFLSKDDDPWLWHKRIAHINMEHLNKLISKDLVIGLPKLKFEKDRLCDAYQKGKQVMVSFKSKNIVSTTQPLQLLHMDLFGPSRTMSFGGNYYALVIVNDYSRFTWTLFLTHKRDFFHAFKNLLKSFKIRKISKLHLLGVIMEDNLKIKILNHFVTNMALNIIFLHLEPLNKMELLRGKIDL